MEELQSNPKSSLDTKHIRYVEKALLVAVDIFSDANMTPSNDRAHSLKSLLYVAIERVGMQADRLIGLQRQLRELLGMINTLADLREYERDISYQLIKEIGERFNIAGKSNTVEEKRIVK